MPRLRLALVLALDANRLHAPRDPAAQLGGEAAMITRPAYCSREDAQRSIDFKDGVDINAALDRGLMSGADNIEAHLHRIFYPIDTTRYFDWPNQGGSGGGQYAQPWRLWLDQHDLQCLTSLVTGGITIPLSQVFAEPVNRKPGFPFTYLELDRSSTAAFGGNAVTPQHSIAGAGTWGFGADADQVATLAADASSGTTTVTLSDGSKAGAGDLLILGYGRAAAPFPSALGTAGAVQPYTGERLLVTGKTMVATGLTQSSGASSASDADQALTWTGSGALNAGEVIQLGSEQMLVESVIGTTATVRRSWNGTTLATHTGATIYAGRQLAVWRGQLGTTAASASSGAAVHKHRVPSLIHDLNIAEAVNRVLQEGSGYSRTVGSGEGAMPAPGTAIAELWDEATTAFGRRARTRAV